MRSSSLLSLQLAALLAILSPPIARAQTQKPPTLSYDPQTDILRLDWQSPRDRTFFPQVTTGLSDWNYIGALHFGTGPHVGMLQSDAPKAFFRLQYSDLPVATEDEAGTADFDLDGLQNLVELQETHTDPLDSDTDNDTLPDGWEVAHSLSPLDNGSIDPANGKDGTFAISSPEGPGVFAPTIITNADAVAAGVQAHPNAHIKDKDGDGISNAEDAGPLSRSIDWKTDGSLPRFLYQPIPGYNWGVHGNIQGCNNKGDVIAQHAVYSGGSWHLLADALTGPTSYLPIQIRVGNHDHNVYLVDQPTASSVSDDGQIVGSGLVHFELFEDEEEGVVYQPPATNLAFVWDSWSSAPELLAHQGGPPLQGGTWDESAGIAGDGTIILRRKADPSIPSSNQFRFDRINPGASSIASSPTYPTPLPSVVGEQGFQAFNIGPSNAYGWLPNQGFPRSLVADSSFSSPNARSQFHQFAEPIYIGVKPGPVGGYCINFWNKGMIRHEGRWQEAVELGDATLLTPQGVALRSRNPNAVQIWKGGRIISLVDAVQNKDFSFSNIYPIDSTVDGRVLINYYRGSEDGSGYLIPLQAAVDSDRDGEVRFGEEKTSAEEPFRFWINNDRDIGHTVDGDDWEEDDVPNLATDGDQLGLESSRDLEDLTRVWIDFSGIASVLSTNDPALALKARLASESGDPQVTLFQPVETDGGRQYLKDEAVGYNQLQGNFGQELCRIAGTATVDIPRRAWGILPEDKVVHLLLEGVSEGDAELIFELWKNGTKLCSFPSIYLRLSKAEEMYETWSVGDVIEEGVDFSKWPAPAATKTGGQNVAVPTQPEEKDYIMFVHGWNMPSWEKRAFASTMFKRMWHQGYKGRFGAFRWPTFHGLSIDAPLEIHTAHFDGSEERAWNSASALRNLLIERESVFGANRVRLYAHSMGNIVCSEALRQMSPISHVRSYISAQSALSSHVWDNTTPNMTFSAPLGLRTPDVYGFYWQPSATNPPHHWQPENRPSYMDTQYMPSNTIYINHYNPFDWALSFGNWQRNQVLKPDVDYDYSVPLWDTVYIEQRFWRIPNQNLEFPADRLEIFSYAAQSHGYATGQQGSTTGVFEVAESLNLSQSFGFESAHKGHSAQFRSTIQKRWDYWTRALSDFEVELPPQ